jgi:inorganic pyrophosphatase
MAASLARRLYPLCSSRTGTRNHLRRAQNVLKSSSLNSKGTALMDVNKISAGKQPPEQINVVIEIPMGSAPIKYEIDKESGALFVDRFLQTSMIYPANYGFIPQTFSGDGDPCDVLVISKLPVCHGAVIPSRPIGVLMMEDESGVDEKILAVPTSKIEPYYDAIKSYRDLPEIFIQQIGHFFEHYKDLEKGKWVKVLGWEGPEKAKQLIQEGLARNQ